MLLVLVAQTTSRPSRWTSPAHPHRWSLQHQRLLHPVLQRRSAKLTRNDQRVLMSHPHSQMMCQCYPKNPMPAMVTRLHQLRLMMKRKNISPRLMRSPYMGFKMLLMIWGSLYLWEKICASIWISTFLFIGLAGLVSGLIMADPVVIAYQNKPKKTSTRHQAYNMTSFIIISWPCQENENRVPVSREEQLSAESSKGRGRGKGKGRGRGRGKGKGDTRKKDDDDNTSKAATERKPKEPRQNSRKKSAPETTAKSKSNKKAKTIPVTPSGAKDETWDHWDGVDAEWHEHWEEEWGEGPHYGWAGWDNSQVWDKAAWEDGRASLYSLHEEKVPEVKRRVRGKQTEPTGASAKTAEAENGKKPRTNKRSKEVKKTDKVKVAKDSGKETTKTKSKKSKNKVPQVEPQVEVTQVVVGSMVDKRTEDLQKILEDFGRNYFDEVDDGITRADLKEFKQEIKEQTIGAMAFKECKFNPYWKRPAAGVRSITQQKDFAYFYFPVEEASWCLCLAVAFKAAQLMVPCLNCVFWEPVGWHMILVMVSLGQRQLIYILYTSQKYIILFSTVQKNNQIQKGAF